MLSVLGIQIVRTGTIRELSKAAQAALEALEERRIHDRKRVITEVLKRGGRGNSYRCIMNRQLVLFPGDSLMMFDHCLHPGENEPLTYLVETRHLDWVCSRLSEGDVAVDVGASGGILSLSFSMAVGSQGRVYTFEPANRAFGLLQDLIALNEIDNIVPEKTAISNRTGSVNFAEYKFDIGDEIGWRPEASAIESKNIDQAKALTYPVPVTTLDEYFGHHPDRQKIRVVKIDVEGFELEVLEGSETLIEEIRPDFCIDIHPKIDGNGTTEEAVRNLLSGFGYQFDQLDHVLVAFQRNLSLTI
ncbi:MAG: FkbM family methyltransferase [Planctomycetes bacterium]|nr:FkbM family methyltransferase [Planctomycetota bacterium]